MKSAIRDFSESTDQDEKLQDMDNHRVNILVVDDLPEKLLVYETLLEELGQNVICVRSGEDALKMVLKEEFAVILLDVNMPGMDGFETASLIRQRKKSSHMPIIFLTAFTDEVRMAQGYASGAVDYLPTPVVPEILRAKVRVFIELSQMRRQAALQAKEYALRTAAEESSRRSEFLMRSSETLSRAQSQSELLRSLIQIPIPSLGDVAMSWLISQDSTLHSFKIAWIKENGTIEKTVSDTSLSGLSLLEKAIADVAISNQTQSLTALPASALFPQSEVHHIQKQDTSSLWSALVIPLTIRDQLSRVLIIARQQPKGPYLPAEISLANDLASRASIALENAMLMEKIKDADRRKDEFLATLAHELRNPLAPIQNALQVIRLDMRRDIQDQAHETIERQTKQMVRLVDDLMDISRITQGKIDLRKEHLSLQDIIYQAVEMAQPLLLQHQHQMKLSLPEKPVWIDADPVRMAQIFSNLINNAAKYTNQTGQLSISVAVENMHTTITIKDNGIGIPQTMLTKIFDMFSQVDNSLERSHGGLGIGLTLVKSLISLHGGTIEAQSDGLNKGSSFIIRLPLSQVKEVESTQTKQNVPETPLSNLNILVVDDNEASAKTLGWMMEISGHTTHIAFDGPSAIEMARKLHPDVVFLDIGLPGMNGYEVCKAMRTDPLMKNACFVAQTGWGQAEHRQRSVEAGFHHHLVKPIDMGVLQQLLGQLKPDIDMKKAF